MIRQIVTHRPLTGWRGIALILAIAVGVILLSNLFSALEPVLGSLYASLLFILCGMGVAGFLLNWYVLGFVYHLENGCLHIRRIYGRRERPMADLWLNSILACGTPEAMCQRFPGARMQRAVKRDCPLAPMAIAYKSNGKTALMLLQPEPPLREAVLKAVRK